uniref:Glypican-4 n=1 Tax=Cacopsylla melanoneura TaxID=428564 RepID=A0A8D8R4X4_9HEMI
MLFSNNLINHYSTRRKLISVFILVSLISVVRSRDLSCANAKYFTNPGKVAVDLLKSPVNGESLKICTSRLTCCSQEQEIQVHNVIRSSYDKHLKQTLYTLSSVLKSRAHRFDGFFKELLSTSKKSFHDMFKRTYGIIYEQNSFLFTDLFEELEKYFSKGNVDLIEVMDNFFSILYQKMFTVLNAQYTFDDKYLVCVSEHMKDLKPFGDVPSKLSVQLKRSFVATRTFQQSLNVAGDIVHNMINMPISLECARSMTKMAGCPMCQGYPNLKPCYNYCANVMKGCVAFQSELDHEWNVFVDAIEKIAERLLGPFNIEMVVEPINIKISEAIMNFQENSQHVSQRVFSGCGKPILGRRKRQVSNSGRTNSRPAFPLSETIDEEEEEDEDEDEEDEDEEEEEEESRASAVSPSPFIPEWLLEVPEDLDVLIVERHFEDAYNLIEKTREFLNETQPSTGRESLDVSFVTEMRKKLDTRVDTLTVMLTKELKVTPEKSLQGGLRSARPFIRVLNQLNKASLSCDLFLALCSSILRAQLKRVRRDGPALNYVSSASTVFFTNLSLMTTELQKVAFPGTGECAAAFVVWATREFNLFVSYVIRELFVTQSSLSSLSPCIAAVSTKCDQLTSLGLDLRYLLDGALRGPLTKALKETRDKLTDTIKLRCSEDKWKPFNLNNRQQRDKFLAEFSEAGLTSMTSYLTGDCWLRLSNNTILFTRLYLSLLQDCFQLATSELLYSIEDTLYVVMQHQLKHVDASLRNDQLADEREFIVQNADFILNNLLTLCENKFEQHFQFKSKKLAQVKKEFQHLA